MLYSRGCCALCSTLGWRHILYYNGFTSNGWKCRFGSTKVARILNGTSSWTRLFLVENGSLCGIQSVDAAKQRKNDIENSQWDIGQTIACFSCIVSYFVKKKKMLSIVLTPSQSWIITVFIHVCYHLGQENVQGFKVLHYLNRGSEDRGGYMLHRL